jgi:hypothetical protein
MCRSLLCFPDLLTIVCSFMFSGAIVDCLHYLTGENRRLLLHTFDELSWSTSARLTRHQATMRIQSIFTDSNVVMPANMDEILNYVKSLQRAGKWFNFHVCLARQDPLKPDVVGRYSLWFMSVKDFFSGNCFTANASSDSIAEAEAESLNFDPSDASSPLAGDETQRPRSV